MRLVFAGTPQVAVPSLEALVASDHEVVAVVTRPDAPAGGADRELSELQFVGCIEKDVVRHDQVRIGRDLQVCRADASLPKAVDLDKKDFRIDDDTIADDAILVLVEDA